MTAVAAMQKRAASLKAGFSVQGIRHGPTVSTAFIDPEPTVRVASIRRIEDDLAVAARVDGVRVETNGRGLQLQFPRQPRQLVSLQTFSSIPTQPGDVLLGVDVFGDPVLSNIDDWPHLAVAGQTGGGKSVSLHSTICWLIAKNRSEDLGVLLCDPKGGEEFDRYEGLTHVMGIQRTADEAVSVLQQLVEQMECRYHGTSSKDRRLVLVIDEWAEIMDQSSSAVLPLKRLLQKARAARIHVILATQRPSVKVIPGDLKANLPTRLCLRVATGTDSRVVLDEYGAEKLLGKGDGLLLTPQGVQRLQVPWVDSKVYEALRSHYA